MPRYFLLAYKRTSARSRKVVCIATNLSGANDTVAFHRVTYPGLAETGQRVGTKGQECSVNKLHTSDRGVTSETAIKPAQLR